MDTGLSDHRAHNRPMDSQVLRVYWRPGCSSCVKVKEFLSQLGVDYQSINVSATPEAMDELREMGVRTVPVVARGREYVFAQALVGRAARQVVPADGEDLLRRAPAARAARALHLALGAACAADHRRARGLRHPARRGADRKGLLRLADAEGAVGIVSPA